MDVEGERERLMGTARLACTAGIAGLNSVVAAEDMEWDPRHVAAAVVDLSEAARLMAKAARIAADLAMRTSLFKEVY